MTFCLMRPNCRNKSLNHVRLYLRLRGFIDNLRASNLDISVRIWAEEPRRFYGSPGGGVALKKHLTKPPEFRGSLFPKGAQCLMIEDQGGKVTMCQFPPKFMLFCVWKRAMLVVDDENVLTKKPIGMKLSNRDILQVLKSFGYYYWKSFSSL